MEEWGEIKSKDEVHEFLKHNCNYEEIINEETGRIIRKVIGVSENNTVEESNYHQKCRQLAYEFFNTVIPEPDPDHNDINLDFNR